MKTVLVEVEVEVVPARVRGMRGMTACELSLSAVHSGHRHHQLRSDCGGRLTTLVILAAGTTKHMVSGDNMYTIPDFWEEDLYKVTSIANISWSFNL